MHRWKKDRREEGKGQGGFKTNVDFVNEHMGMCDICTRPSLSESIHLCQPLHCHFTPFTRGVQQVQRQLDLETERRDKAEKERGYIL